MTLSCRKSGKLHDFTNMESEIILWNYNVCQLSEMLWQCQSVVREIISVLLICWRCTCNSNSIVVMYMSILRH